MNDVWHPFSSCRLLDSHAGVHVGGINKQFQQGRRLVARHIDVIGWSQTTHLRKRVSGRGVWGGSTAPNYRRHKGVRGKVICYLLQSSTSPRSPPSILKLLPSTILRPLRRQCLLRGIIWNRGSTILRKVYHNKFDKIISKTKQRGSHCGQLCNPSHVR
jgi:hypothetical protein